MLRSADAPTGRSPERRRRFLTLLLLILLALTILSMAALGARQRYQTRGIPSELPGPIAHADVSPYGINVAMLDWDDAQRLVALEHIAGANMSWIKQTVNWAGAPQLDPGTAQPFDHLLQTAVSLDLQVVALLDGDPSSGFAPPTDPQHFAAWAGEVATRFGDRITYYQIWDEPNLGRHWGGQPVNPVEYAALLAAAHDAITAADRDAVIIAAALAPTTQVGPENLADADYMAGLYQAGAAPFFDVAAGKPYGFDTGPDDRRVGREVLNFSRLILLREVMEAHGDGDSALWAGNLGWNALPESWSGRPSIWGQTDTETQAEYTRLAYGRASEEWPWAGVLFLENYAPSGESDDPRWGFALVDADLSPRSPLLTEPWPDRLSHYQLPSPERQTYAGGWRFDPRFGADVSQSGDSVRFDFEGTDVGVTVRRGDYRAYFYVTVDGEPANALPTDDRGAYLNLTSPDWSREDIVTVTVARNLAPRRHTAELVAERGWGQWALVGFSSGNLADRRPVSRAIALLSALAIGVAIAAWVIGRRVNWGTWNAMLQLAFGRLGQTAQVAVAAVVAGAFALTGWLTWLYPAGGPFRRLGDESQTLVVACAAALFYLSPWLLLNIASGVVLFVLIFWRLEIGLALVALSAPFYVYPKPIAGYRFSPVEMFILVTAAAWSLNWFLRARRGRRVRTSDASDDASPLRHRLTTLDLAVAMLCLVALASLLFTERLDVATNELRVVVLEPALFYLLLRTARLQRRQRWLIVDGFVLGGALVALLGLIWYITGSHAIAAEGGLPRLRSIYGSPNNVGLYLGRVIPLLLAIVLTGRGLRRLLYGAALLPALAAVALSFSKGAILLGLPVGVGLIVALLAVQRWGGRKTAIVLTGLVILAVVGLLIATQIPALAGRLSLAGATTDFRVSLWKASVDMIKDHPWTGVGLDNFLYAYRGRYLRPEAWQEPNLSHPHNIVLDYWTRLGIMGLAAGLWIQVAYWELARRALQGTRVSSTGVTYDRVLVIGLMGGMAATLAHGLVDQSAFLIDLAYALMLNAALIASLARQTPPAVNDPR